MNVKIMYSIVMLTSLSLINAQPWYADHHKRQTVDQLAAGITQHEQASKKAYEAQKDKLEQAKHKIWLRKYNEAVRWSIAAHHATTTIKMEQIEAEAAAKEAELTAKEHAVPQQTVKPDSMEHNNAQPALIKQQVA